MTDHPGPEHFHVYDTTLRDGAQQEGLRLSIADKLRIAANLDELGVTFIEGGWPGANPKDTNFFEAMRRGELTLKNSTLTAFGFTRRVGRRAADDPMIAAVRDSGASVACLVAKSHDQHVERALRASLQENLAMVADSVEHLVAEGQRVFLDAEHFFDGYRANREYALEVVRTAAEAGAEVVVLCDTNGGMLPSWMHDIVGDTAEIGVDLGIHCHNDSGCAVANTLAAVEGGAMHVQGTINGYGERTGNADLLQVVANLELKFGWSVLADGALAEATRISHAIAAITNVPGSPRQPYVGSSAFAHKAGLHASAIRVDPNLYQHIDPAVVGNDMRTLVSDMAGRANIQLKGEELGFDISDRELAARITDTVKERESRGYSYEAADASFELLLRSELGELAEPFTVHAWQVHTDYGDGRTSTGASVRLSAKGAEQEYRGEGNGPVNALDEALRRALLPAYPQVADYQLTDYRVRILDQGHGTDASVRVLIDTDDGERSWTTVGVGENVVEASWEALSDAYLYGLIAR
ncbi:citramalate synthase [Enemella evansiae]|uniref:citramalate synthase n=1 Tax=Enemella evansiae TaxID=2016499 RepID=UPI000B96DCBE|nr:citramalate synthase [Enemella evansiae]OYO05606.1 citramalate synthase [Enemella evansiae]